MKYENDDILKTFTGEKLSFISLSSVCHLQFLGDASQLTVNLSKVLVKTNKHTIKPTALHETRPAPLKFFLGLVLVFSVVDSGSEGLVLVTVGTSGVVGVGPLQ